MTKAVIFDLYGVLALNGWQAFKAQHFSKDPEAAEELFELGRQVDAGLAEFRDFVRLAAEQTGESEETVRYQLEHTAANEQLLDYISTELKPHYSIGILSNASSDDVLERVFTPEQRHSFDAVIFSHHVGHTKPAPEMYEAAAARLGVLPSECVFVDDQERHVAGARAVGMHGVLYEDLAQLRTELAGVLA
jgi:putative hydrolase of the HAD superfamily